MAKKTLKELQENDAIVVATGNRGKVKEIKAILGSAFPGTDFYALAEIDLPTYLEPEETGSTFAENALIKAKSATDAFALRAIADDSGLCVDALGGAPGVFSARWAGAHGDDAANNVKLLEELGKAGAQKPQERTAHFVSSVALTFPSGEVLQAEGVCNGSIAFSPRGTQGFGYDPLFLADDLGGKKTTAEVPAEEKNKISHRAKALHALGQKIKMKYDNAS